MFDGGFGREDGGEAVTPDRAAAQHGFAAKRLVKAEDAVRALTVDLIDQGREGDFDFNALSGQCLAATAQQGGFRLDMDGAQDGV